MGRKSKKKEPQRLASHPMTGHDILHGFDEPSLSIYVILADAAAVKIGVSNSPGARARAIQTSQEKNITVYWAARMRRADAFFVEKTIHKRLGKTAHHSSGEWYYIDPNEAVSIILGEIKKQGFKVVADISFGTERNLAV